MTDREIEKAYRKMTETEAPNLWEKIEGQLPEKALQAEALEGKEADVMKQSFWKRIGRLLFGGGTFRTAVSICVMCVVLLGAVQLAGSGIGQISVGMGSSTGSSGAASAAGAQERASVTGGTMAAAGNGGMDYSAAEEQATAEAADASAASVDEEAGEGTQADEVTQGTGSERKLIRSIYMEVETLDFDVLVTDLQQRTQTLGGYLESSSISGNSYYYDGTRTASLTLRIPKDQTDSFLEQVGDMANVISRSEDVQDVTLTYVDLESHVTALETEQETLMKLLEDAQTVEDTMSIQSRLSEVRYQLESYMSQLKTYDNQVDYDTITVWVDEVTKTTPTTELSVWEQMKEGFANSIIAIGEGIKDLCIWVVAHIPYFIILFAVVLAGVVIVKKRHKRK